MRRLTLLLPICCIALQASAQGSELRPGIKVRVTAPGLVAGRLEGTLLARTADSITIGGPDVAPLTIPVAGAASIEISHGKSHGKGALKGLEWGTGLGLGFGLVFMNSLTTCTGSSYTTPSTRKCGVDPTSTQKQGFASFMALTGAFYGTIIGAIAGSQQWDRFDLPARPALEMRSGRPALSLSFGF